MNILILNGLNNKFPEFHYLQVMQRNMNAESEKDKVKEYNLKGMQVHRFCTRLLLDSPNKFDTNSINDVPIQKLFITNLAKKTTQEDLLKFFTSFGKVEECVMKKNKKSNYAFITFAKVENALQALKSTNRLHDKDLTVIPADSRHQPSYRKKERKVTNELKEKSTEQICSPSSSTEVYPLVHRISDNCLMNIFNYLPIVDRVRVEGVCRRWRDLSLDSWRTLRRLDVNSSSWGCKNAEIGTSDLYQVLKRCGRFITTITFFEKNRMMSLRTLFIIGKLCPHLKIAYLGTLEVTPREIFFLLSQCSDLEFLEFDGYHFSDRDFSEIFSKSKKLKYVSLEESKADGSCFINLSEEIETIVFHEPTRGVNHLVFHSAIQRLKNLQNLYLSISHHDEFNDIGFDFGDDEMGIPVFDDRDEPPDEDADDFPDDGNDFVDEVDDFDVDADDFDQDADDFDQDADDFDQDAADDCRDNDEDLNSDSDNERFFHDILIMMNDPRVENDAENNPTADENVEKGQNSEPSAKKDDTDPSGTNQSEKKVESSAKKEDPASCTDDDFNDKDDLESEEEELNFRSIALASDADALEQKEDKQASTNKDEDEAKHEKTDTSNTRTSDSKTSDVITSDNKTSDSKESDSKSSNDRKDETLESNAKKREEIVPTDSSDDLFETDSSNSSTDIKEETTEDKKDKESDSNGKENNREQGDESKHVKETEKCRNYVGDDFDDDDDDNYEDVDEDHDWAGGHYDDFDNDYNECDAYDDFFDDYDDYDDYGDYDDEYDDDGFDVENDFEYESNLGDTIKETIRNCNKNLKVLQLKKCNPAGLTSADLIANFTNFTSLERLDLSKMKVVNDELLSIVGANCPKLSVLVINACDTVTDTGIGGIALLPELKHLSMTDLPNVTGKQLETICGLKTLYCARCTSLQEEGLDQLILNSHELEQLDVQMCKLISNSLVDIVLVAMQSRTNNIKLKIFARGSAVDVGKIETKSQLLEILMDRRCEEQDSFVDGDLGTEQIGFGGDLQLRDFRGMVFESSTSDKNKED